MRLPAARRPELSVADHVAGVLAGDRAVLARTITLVESHHPAHRARAQEVLAALMPHTGGALRVGLTGVPGVGKSTLLERLGAHLTASGRRVAVLAVDPSSALRGGSILGDKTRMPRLANDPAAFVRPSPSEGGLGGVHRKTREALLICEAAGFDVVLVETVGVGQSEIAVAHMVDTFVVLLLAGAGDQLQGIKKGVLEVADLLAVNKADGDNRAPAERAAGRYREALRYFAPRDPGWRAPVLTLSGLSGEGVTGLWEAVVEHRASLEARGVLEPRRAEQRQRWTWSLVEEALMSRLRAHPGVQALLGPTEAAVRAGATPPTRAALTLVEAFLGPDPPSGGEP